MYKRAIAYKLPIAKLFEGEYVQPSGEYEPNHIKVDGKEVSRVNVIAKTRREDDDIFLEDKTGKIKAMSFDYPLDIDEGKTVRVIGKIRELGEERFLAVETMVEIDEKEMKLRELELAKASKDLKEEENTTEEDPDDDIEMEIEDLEI